MTAPESSSPSEMTMPEPRPGPASDVSRAQRLRSALIDLFQDLSGLSLGECDPSATFLEMGFDSLFLTQVTQALQSKFGLRITFRQLLDQESTLHALAAYIDARLPPEAVSAEPARPTIVPAEAASAGAAPPAAPQHPRAVPFPAGQTTIESVVREQLQAMSQLMAKQLGCRAVRAPSRPLRLPSCRRLRPLSP